MSKEVTAICEEIGIADVNINCVPIKVIKEAMLMRHYADMKTEPPRTSKNFQ